MLLVLLSFVHSEEYWYEKYNPVPNTNTNIMFNKIGDVWVMTFMVMFLMMMVKKFEWGVAGASILCIVSSYLVYALIYYFHVVNPISNNDYSIDNLEYYLDSQSERNYMMMMLQAKSIICAITLLIAVGSFVGLCRCFFWIFVRTLTCYCDAVFSDSSYTARRRCGKIVRDIFCHSLQIVVCFYCRSISSGFRRRGALWHQRHLVESRRGALWR
jgi:hypothetical protein